MVALIGVLAAVLLIFVALGIIALRKDRCDGDVQYGMFLLYGVFIAVIVMVIWFPAIAEAQLL